jgi:RNA polymerase sigma-70 factor (ECF subfamily)
MFTLISGGRNLIGVDGHNKDVKGNFDELTDGELWSMASEQRSAPFGELFERHEKTVYNYCFRRTGSWSTAQDLTSVVFLEAWRKRHDVRLHGDSILPWLISVANNCIRNSERSLRRHRRLLARMYPPDDQLNVEDVVAERLDDERTMNAVLEKLKTLSMNDREILALCDWFRFSYAEAAVALDIPVGTVRSRLSRARAVLREQIGDFSMTTGSFSKDTTSNYRGGGIP